MAYRIQEVDILAERDISQLSERQYTQTHSVPNAN